MKLLFKFYWQKKIKNYSKKKMVECKADDWDGIGKNINNRCNEL